MSSDEKMVVFIRFMYGCPEFAAHHYIGGRFARYDPIPAGDERFDGESSYHIARFVHGDIFSGRDGDKPSNRTGTYRLFLAPSHYFSYGTAGEATVLS
ncbi:hypothetical protein [Cohnella rhizosphaerae]|uniref:hypothetical protein n=1 Tax=Cohnella rhizosphaerae TaxID=1457232 RepID=UPI0030B91349